MIKEIYLNDTKIQYDLQYKKVKNINLRIKPNGTIYVSANGRVSQKVIEGFMLSKAELILKTLEKCKNKAPIKQYFAENEICGVVTELCNRAYPYFERLGIKYPQIKFRKMVSRWGSCQPKRGVLTFNTNLMYAPIECIEYVVLHEFTHFLKANHSSEFYEELEKVCPDWRECRNKLRDI